MPDYRSTFGATPFRKLSTNDTNGVTVKSTGGTLYTLVVINLNAAVRYLKVYNKGAPVVGTDTPAWTFAIPASTTGNGFVVPLPPIGVGFDTGIGLGITTGVADNDTGAPAANEVIVNGAHG